MTKKKDVAAIPSNNQSNTINHPTFIDLFCGCGGLSLGMQEAGFAEIASIDSDPNAIAVFKQNFPQVPQILNRDLKKYSPEKLASLIGLKHVDVVIGGPPCQGFSIVRQVDGANSGKRLVKDNRRNLYREFLKYVLFFKPKLFVIENVLGIRSAAGGKFFTKVQSEARDLGYRVHGEIIHAWEYGVPQKRARQLIIGTRIDMPIFSANLFMQPTNAFENSSISDRKNGIEHKAHLQPIATVWEAIGDLPPLKAAGGHDVSKYDTERSKKHLKRYGKRYLIDVLELDQSDSLTAHRARQHSERDLRDFARLREGENCAHAIDRGEHMEFPYDRENFKDRYTRQHRNKLCSTIVAHLSKDGLMFIHPTQNRSLTPREAARIQSFPDWFQFPVPQTHQFRLIGNAVPPLIGKALGNGVKKWLAATKRVTPNRLKALPNNEREAVTCLLNLVEASEKNTLTQLPIDEFKKGWFAVGFIHNHLHPDSIRDNGTKLIEDKTNASVFARLPSKLASPSYALSGWPINLAPIAEEAQRRFYNGELSIWEYYYSEAQTAGLKWVKDLKEKNAA